MTTISGKELAARVKERVKEQVAELKARGVVPCLAVILVGDNPASRVYVNGKEKDCIECGIESRVIRMPETTAQDELLREVRRQAAWRCCAPRASTRRENVP